MARPVTRRAVLASGIASIAGVAGIAATTQCDRLPGERVPDPAANPAFGEVNQLGDLELSSPAFQAGDRIPNKYGHFFEDVNPPLVIDGVPEDAHSLALILDGPDAPGGEFTNWLVWNIPPDTHEIPKGWTPPEQAVQGANSAGGSDYGYFGPDPPNKQTYRFKLYAVTATVDLPQGASKRELGEVLDGHVVAQTRLTAWYDFHTAAHDSISAGGGHSSLLETVCSLFDD